VEDRKKLLIYLVVLISLLVVVSSIWIYQFTSLSPSSSSQLEDCKTLSNPGGAINLLFFSTKDQAQQYSSYLLEKNPLKENKDDFAVRYIDTYTPLCDLYQQQAILCYSKELIERAASCPHDYIFVTDSKDSAIRSSSYMGVMSINTNHPMSVTLHEFGHAFANFAEEYAPAKIPRGSKNCASSCDKFSDPSSCFEECSDSSHFRSIDEGIMRTLSSEDYGANNDKLLEEKIKSSSKSSLSGFAVASSKRCSEQQYLLVKAQYDGTNLNVLNKEIKTGCPAGADSGQFSYQVTSGAEVITKAINPELIFTDAPSQSNINGETYENKEPFYLSVPLVSEQQSTIFLDENNNQIGSLNIQDLKSRPCEI
jgi:hypothetical protein